MMEPLSEEKLKELAEELEIGYDVFVHKTTGEIHLRLDGEEIENEWSEDDEDEDIETEEIDLDDYYEIPKWSSRDAFEFMSDFTEELTGNNALKNKLINALSKKNPFQEFNKVINQAGEFRQKWFDYRTQRQIDYVDFILIGLMDEE